MTKKAKDRSRGWCFTLNNYTEDSILWLDSLDVQYIIYGKEIGKKGTPHLQGYLYLKNPKTFKTIVEKYLCESYHIEPSKQKHTAAAILYCMKDNNYTERGQRPRQGHRSDLDLIRVDLTNKVDEKKIAKDYFPQWCQYRRAFNEYKDLIANEKTTTLVFYDEDICSSAAKAYDLINDKHYTYKILDQYENLWDIFYSKKYDIILCGSKYRDYVSVCDKNNIYYINIYCYGKVSEKSVWKEEV